MKIYIAGPEVFLENAIEVLGAKKRLCAQYGHEGVSPFDTDIENVTNDLDCGLRIAAANEGLIEECDAVIANISPYRGHNADPGTIYEIGYARGRRKLIFAYTYDKMTHSNRICTNFYKGNVEDFKDFKRGRLDKQFIDDFGMAENAMIDGGVTASGGDVVVEESFNLADTKGFEACLHLLVESLLCDRLR